MKIRKWNSLTIFVALFLSLTACDDNSSGQQKSASSNKVVDQDVHPRLLAHSGLFEKKVLNPTDGVYVAVGYGLANSIMIEGDDGIVIVDTLESRSRAKEVLTEFRKITSKPVKGIIYTHNHADHIYGAKVFAENRNIPVYAHRTTLLPGDNIYRTFPNLYTIRGTAYRNVLDWVHSIDLMRDLKAETLVPSHTLPVKGAEIVDEILTVYRDAIQFVHDQTVRGINKGLTPDQLVEFVRLPQKLARHPWLTEHYGTVPWSVRAIFAGYLGWFNGDSVELEPLSPRERSERLSSAFTAGKTLGEQARSALSTGDNQWAAELSRHWLNLDPNSEEARKVLAEALTKKGQANLNSNARHWYLTQAKELRGDLELSVPDPSKLPDDFLAALPIESFLSGMTTRLIAEDTDGIDQVVQFDFTDLKRSFTLHIRNGVAALREVSSETPDLGIQVSSFVWKQIATKKRNPIIAFAAGEVRIQGGVNGVINFLSLFET